MQCKERLKILEAIVIQRKQPTINKIIFHRGLYIEIRIKRNKIDVKIQFDCYK